MSLWLLSGLIRTRSTAEALERLQDGYVSEEYVALNEVCEWDPYSRSSLAQARELVTIVGGSPHPRNDGCADPNVALDFFSTLKSSPRALIEEEVRGDASIGKCSVPLKTFFWPMTALSYDGMDPGVPAPALVGKSLFSTMTLHLALPRVRSILVPFFEMLYIPHVFSDNADWVLIAYPPRLSKKACRQFSISKRFYPSQPSSEAVL
ncbi:uncharacterized protein ARMOST_14319 [Armillaria ostoyae]|uniref:Uncharacterized protein n=1 Tax=Armillaria ostoyae TaxID=47428 RepID=A0A284RQ96_ARMOS|nr:uncharacterized protein ARMOST_14319 [Armillaria ostoyae]